MTRKIILDLDTGIDDALALAYALGSPELELIGITGTYGNVTVDTGVANDLALLELLGHPEVPVHPGIEHASTREFFEVLDISAFIHGRNGVGEVELPVAAGQPADAPAVDFLVESAREHGEDLVIVATGPMTNLAAAAAKDPEFLSRAHIVVMGGALTVPGNVSAWAEANINQDPDAADRLFRNAGDLTMVGLDVTLRTLLTYEETSRWREAGTEAGRVFADMTDYYIRAYETTAPHLGGCGLHDPLAVGVAVNPDLVRLLPVPLKVDVTGPTRGRTIADETRLDVADPGTRAAVGVDAPAFLSEFMTRVGRALGV